MTSAASLDRARMRVAEAGGPVLLERLDHLDAIARSDRGPDPAAASAPGPSDTFDFDVAIVGGGLWSILAPVLARRGLRVAIFDRATVGEAHREWNASAEELEALLRAEVVGPEELASAIVARYSRGFCRFGDGSEHVVRGALDHAVDAATLLGVARRRAEDAGAAVHDHHTLVGLRASAHGVRCAFRDRERVVREVTARYVVDARGASSPYATYDLVCPTVGGVVEGIDEGTGRRRIDPGVGEILVTTEGVEDGVQHVWEAFPGRAGETTVYLFHYARPEARGSLVALYARFFERLPRYKSGAIRLLRPTFGYIPGWSRFGPPPEPPHPRVVLVGDAAARQSPLTYCGFGATLRSLAGVADALEAAVGERATGLGRSLVDDRPIHEVTGALAALMASGAFVGDELNALLDAAFGAMARAGNESYASILKDTASAATLLRFLFTTSLRHPAVWSKVARGLGPRRAAAWAARAFGRAAVEATSRGAR